jgi:peptide/nickel transport system substrate-binding protein
VRRRRIPCILALLALVACTRAGAGHHENVLRIADLADPDRFNPLLSTMDLTEHLSALVYSTLVIANDRGQLIGDLATEVPSLANGGISKDGKTVRYRLRGGVRWHDGEKFTSRDVAFTWRIVMNPANNVFHREGYEDVASIDTPDDLTVVVHLKHRSPPFVTRFFTALQEGEKVVLPEHLLRDQKTINESPFNASPIGTGPFKFVRWDRGRGIEFVANDDYFRGRPKIDRIKFSVVPDENTMLNQARAGEIDLPQLTSNMYPAYKKIPGIVTELWPTNGVSVLALNDAHPGLRHVEVRQAIVRAIDFGSLLEKITHGVGTVAHDIIPPQAIGYVNNPAYPHDVAAARKLLEDAGWKAGADGVRVKDGERLEFVYYTVTGGATGNAIAVQVQAWLRQIGIAVNLKSSPYNQIFSYEGPIQNGTYDFAAFSYTMPWDPDNHMYLGCDQFPHRGENVYRFCDPSVDAGELRGLTTDDPRARAAIYAPVERRVHEMVPYIPLYLARRAVAHVPALKNYRPAPSIQAWWNPWEWEVAQ